MAQTTISTASLGARRYRSGIEGCMDRVARWLPHQGPIKEFIHHNTLHAFEEFPFYEACLRASRLYGSWAFFPLA